MKGRIWLMEFLNIGMQELLFIAILALIVLGPERLPDMMRRLGRLSAQLRDASGELRRALEEETRDLCEPIDQVRRDLDETVAPIRETRDEVKALASEIKPTLSLPPNQVSRTPTLPAPPSEEARPAQDATQEGGVTTDAA